MGMTEELGRGKGWSLQVEQDAFEGSQGELGPSHRRNS